MSNYCITQKCQLATKSISPTNFTEQLSNGRLLHDYTVDCEQITGNIVNISNCCKPYDTKLLIHQKVARLLMDYGRVSLSDYFFLIFISTRRELTPKDFERYRELILENSAIAISRMFWLPLPIGGYSNV